MKARYCKAYNDIHLGIQYDWVCEGKVLTIYFGFGALEFSW